MFTETVYIPNLPGYCAGCIGSSWAIVNEKSGKPVNGLEILDNYQFINFIKQLEEEQAPSKLGEWCMDIVNKGNLRVARYGGFWYLYNRKGLRISNNKYINPDDIQGK